MLLQHNHLMMDQQHDQYKILIQDDLMNYFLLNNVFVLYMFLEDQCQLELNLDLFYQFQNKLYQHFVYELLEELLELFEELIQLNQNHN